jgi:preprotein translocase subunit SecA
MIHKIHGYHISLMHLKLIALYFNNVHYIVQNNRIIIVDEFTGRIMPDRRWGDGLHQAIEAKEKLPIRQKTETVAAITYQNFFLLISKTIWNDWNRKNSRN